MVAVNADVTIERLIRWAQARDDVRALILTSTRAIPHARLDAYSDYDVIAIVRDVRPMLADTRWQADFGEVLLAYWDPVTTNPATGAESVSSITQYMNGLKIDFTLWSAQQFTDVSSRAEPHAELDAGYQVLLDKDGLSASLPAPTYTPIFLGDPMTGRINGSSLTSSSGSHMWPSACCATSCCRPSGCSTSTCDSTTCCRCWSGGFSATTTGR